MGLSWGARTSTSSSTWVQLLTLAGLVAAASGLKCFSCNSHYDRNCADPFNNYTTQLVDCAQQDHTMSHLPLKEDNTRYTANICRKTVQIVGEEERIVRSCGWLPNPAGMEDRDCFTRTGTHQVMVYHCVCGEDGCNPASRPAATFLLASLAAALVLL